MRLLISSICLILILFAVGLKAQTSEFDTLVNDTQIEKRQLDALSNFDEKQDYLNFRHFATFSLSAFINTTPGFQVGYEYLITDRLSAVGEAGYLLFKGEGVDIRQGVRLKGEGRFYASPKFFLSLEVVYKRTVSQITDWVDVMTHEQLLSFKGIRRFFYGGPKLGFVTSIDREKRIYFEMGTTVGVGRYQVSNQGLPSQYRIIDNPGLFWNETFSNRTNIYPILSMSMKIKYNFGGVSIN